MIEKRQLLVEEGEEDKQVTTRRTRPANLYLLYAPDRSLAAFEFAKGRLAGYVKYTPPRPQRSSSLLRKGELHFQTDFCSIGIEGFMTGVEAREVTSGQ